MNIHARMAKLSPIVESAHKLHLGEPGEQREYDLAKTAFTLARSYFTLPRIGSGLIRAWVQERKAVTQAVLAAERYLAKFGRGLALVER